MTGATVNGAPAQSFNTINGSAFLTASSTSASSWSWVLTNGSGSIYPNGTTGQSASCNVSTSSFIRVEARASNRCGTGDFYTFYLSSGNPYYGYRAASNPASDHLSVLFDFKEIVSELLTSVSLVDNKGQVLRSFDAVKARASKDFVSTDRIDFDVKQLTRGTYFLHVGYGKDTVLKSQIILE